MDPEVELVVRAATTQFLLSRADEAESQRLGQRSFVGDATLAQAFIDAAAMEDPWAELADRAEPSESDPRLDPAGEAEALRRMTAWCGVGETELDVGVGADNAERRDGVGIGGGGGAMSESHQAVNGGESALIPPEVPVSVRADRARQRPSDAAMAATWTAVLGFSFVAVQVMAWNPALALAAGPVVVGWVLAWVTALECGESVLARVTLWPVVFAGALLGPSVAFVFLPFFRAQWPDLWAMWNAVVSLDPWSGPLASWFHHQDMLAATVLVGLQPLQSTALFVLLERLRQPTVA